MSRYFAGANDEVRFTIPTGQEFDGAVTLAAVIHRGAASSGFMGIECFENTLGQKRLVLGISVNENLMYETANAGSESTFQMTPSNAWMIAVAQRAAGSGNPVHFDMYEIAIDTWVGSTGALPMDDSAGQAGGQLSVGEIASFDDYEGYLAVTAGWRTDSLDPTDLAATLSTQAWLDLGPQFLHEWNGLVADPVVDLTGNGWDQVAISGTVEDGSNPPGWVYGAAPSNAQKIRPDADLAATGWTTAPLHSKLADESDATLITGALT